MVGHGDTVTTALGHRPGSQTQRTFGQRVQPPVFTEGTRHGQTRLTKRESAGPARNKTIIAQISGDISVEIFAEIFGEVTAILFLKFKLNVN